MQSLSEIIARRAAESPDRTAFVFLADGEAEARRLTDGEVDGAARAVGAWLAAAGLGGERAVLLFPPGLDFVTAFLGCLDAGTVAVPAYPPSSRRTLPRLAAIAGDARPAVVLTDAASLPRLQRLCAGMPELAGLRWQAVDALPTAAPSWRPAAPAVADGEATAFLQYTSGSTAAPKGVMVSHANLLHNEETIRRAFAQSAESVVVGWLPLYHDMGLIGTVLQPLYTGATCVLMPPLAFLQRPVRWLRAISRYRATTSGGPDFAYALCARRIAAADREGLDLASWQVAFSGAEPVRAATLDLFAGAFAPCGFRRASFYPCYGLAEATLFVAGGAVGEAPRIATVAAAALERHEVRRLEPEAGERTAALVGCGGAWLGQEIAIVDPATQVRSAADRVGEIWLAGDSVARGYWGQPEATAADFGARLADEPAAGPYLRTGDLGFLDRGELFVTGRLKDLVILRGRNHYPQDIERTAEAAHPALRPGASAAFGVEASSEAASDSELPPAVEERLVIACEIDPRSLEPGERSYAAVAEAVRGAVAEEHEAQVHEVVLLRAAALPKTSSGKVRRQAARAVYLDGSLAALWRSGIEDGSYAGSESSGDSASAAPPVDAPLPGREALWRLEPGEREARVLGWLRTEAARAARLPAALVGPMTPLLQLGLDSLAAVSLQQSIAEGTDIEIPLADLLAASGAAELTREILARLAAAPASRPAADPSPWPAEPAGEDDLPLSHGQQALWFLHRLAPASGAYHIVAAARLARGGEVDAAALGRALAALARRHAALRTTFHSRDGEPRRRVQPVLAPGFEVVAADGATAAEVEALLLRAAYRPFDLAAGPLLRVALVRGGSGGDRLLVAIHHLVADFWSMGVLARDLGSLYAAETGGPAADLPPIPVSFSQLVERDAARLAGGEGEALWRYWQERLAGAPTALALPTDRPRPPAPSDAGAVLRLRLPPAAAAALAGLARQHGATLFIALLAAYQALLHRHTGQEDLLVGVPAAGRAGAERRDLVGYLVNPLAVRGKPAGERSFAELLAAARRETLEDFDHQAFPFPLLAERLRAERDPARTPIFQATLVLQRAGGAAPPELAAFAVGEPAVPVALGSLALETLALPEPFAQFELALRAAELDGALVLSLQYAARLFDAATMCRLLDHFARLLAAAAADPRCRLGDLPLLAAAERWQLAAEWSDTAADDGPPEASLHQLIAAQARRTPEAIAVVAEDRSIDYAELLGRARRLARRLAALGVGAESRVGLCAERSIELMVGLVGILAAGAAYVPLDPEYPAERLAFMVEDAVGAGGVVIVAAALAGAPGRRWPGVRELVLDESGPVEADEKSAADSDVPLPATAADTLAYVIYTSGSTGRPKGVMNGHRAVVNRLRWMQRLFPLTAEDRVLQKTPASFDVSVWELFWPLAVGASVVLARPGGHRDPAYLVRRMGEQRVTVVHFVPSLLPAFLDEAGGGRLAALRRVFASGEALSYELEQRALARLGVPLENLYGPTEAAVDVTLWHCREATSPRPVPIGRPAANTRVHVVEPGGGLAPIGVPGELWIGGVQVARGYQGRPELTAESFVPDPWTAEAGARAYRSGDLARWQAGGELEYLGRLDLQVKVRGVRVELAEVEAALAAEPEVRAAAVLALGDGAAARLVAFVVGEPSQESGAAAMLRLRERLRDRLPPATVPAAVVALAELPLTPNGKLDRRALALLAPQLAAADGGEPPRTAVEELLAAIWRDLLGEEADGGVSGVGRAADFFALGGHSLLATRLAARVERTFGVDLTLPAIFGSPALAAMAARIEALRAAAEPGAAAPSPSRPIRPIPRDRPLPLSFAQQRLWFIDRLEPGGAHYNLPALLRLRGRLDRAALAAVFAELARRHEVLRTSFPAVAGSPVQEIAPAAPPEATALPLIDLRGLAPLPAAAAAELARLARQEARRPFDLERGPLWRATLVAAAGAGAGEEHALLVTLHHVVADGWSVGVLEREVAALYGAFAAGLPSPLAPLPVQYADFAAWQAERFRGELLEREVAWWRERLDGTPAELTLPFDRPRPPLAGHRGGRVELRIPLEAGAAIAGGARRSGATVFMTLLAAFQALLARYGGETLIPVGTPVANRLQPEVEGLVGFFVNTLVLRGDLAGDPTVAELLARTRSAALAAYAHQELPFEKLVEALAPERRLGRTPLVQVLLALQNTPSPGLALPALRLTREEVESGTAKLDLAVMLAESSAGLAGTIEYDAELFDRATAARLAGHLARLLAAVVEELPAGETERRAARRLSELPLLSGAESAQLLVEWAADGGGLDGAGPAVPWIPLHELVAARARLQPEATAVEPAGPPRRSLTYGELAARSSRLARRLRTLGVGPEVAVAQLVERSPEMIVGILAVLAAGGAVVPLDPALPRERLALLLADVRPLVVLTREGLAAGLPAGGFAVVLLDAPDALASEPASAPSGAVAASPAQLAYVLYTSGSTGRPKGVEISHGALANFVAWYRRAFAVRADDRASFLSGIAFDAAAMDLWPPLAAGAAVHLPDEATRTAPAALRDWLVARRITIGFVTTIVAEALVRLDWPPATALRRLLTGGERLGSPPPAGLPFELVNVYGPTECTIITTTARVPARRSGDRSPELPVVGRPIDGAAVRLLDRALRPVPVGLPGELYVAGRGLGRGYRGRPELTAERFVPDPLSPAARRAPLPHRRPGALAARRASSTSSAVSTIR